MNVVWKSVTPYFTRAFISNHFHNLGTCFLFSFLKDLPARYWCTIFCLDIVWGVLWRVFCLHIYVLCCIFMICFCFVFVVVVSVHSWVEGWCCWRVGVGTLILFFYGKPTYGIPPRLRRASVCACTRTLNSYTHPYTHTNTWIYTHTITHMHKHTRVCVCRLIDR